jgi:hypothetical protein
MNIRFLTESDYDNTLTKWWSQWNWESPLRDMLPENGTGGLIISSEGIDICAGFIYFTNSKMAWVEYIVSNKEYKEDDRSEAIELLINALCSIIKDKGFKYVYTSLKSKHLINKYENCGFSKGDANCQEMIKKL